MTIRSKYRLSPELESRGVEDTICHLDICIIGLDWDWDELEERDACIITDSLIYYCLEGEDDDPTADFTVQIPETILTDAINHGGDETALQVEWCEEQWERIKENFKYHEGIDDDDD